MAINIGEHLTFLGTDDAGAARQFYEDVIGLRFAGDENGTLLFDMGGTPLRITALDDFRPQTFTVLGWDVADIEGEATTLIAAGVAPIRYPGMPHDEQGIVQLGSIRILWFADPAGNVLSLTGT